MRVVSSSDSPQHSDQVSLEVALLKSSAPDETSARTTLVVASNVDVLAYLSESLRQIRSIEVVAASSTASALDSGARLTPRLLVVADQDRAVLRHFPAVPAVLLSEDVPPEEVMDARLAPLIVLRGAVGAQRLLEVATSLLEWDRKNVTQVAGSISHVANAKETT
jgi:hypothetical protein